MYKVFFVDDEELVIKSLKASVNWGEYGFEIAGHALDGAEAFARIREMKPEVVFTDVRMPGSSGLELIKNCKEINLNTIFIVVSGYAEFAYAQKAMNYGALGYCLKPFDDIEIISFLKKAKELLDRSNGSESMQLMDLIEENDEKSRSAIEGILRENGLPNGSGRKLGILVSVGRNKLAFGENSHILALKTGYEKYAYFVPETEMAYARSFVDQKPEGIRGVGISRDVDAGEIKKAIQQAEIMAYDYFTACVDRLPTGRQGEIQENTEPIKRLEDLISRKDAAGAIAFMDGLPEQFEQCRLNIRHALIIYNQIMTFNGRLMDIPFEEYIYSFEMLASSYRNVRDMLGYLKGVLAGKLDLRYESCSMKSMNQTFKSILRYVNENYCRDISAQNISKDFNVNSNYFSQLFKKEMGIAFTEYLARLRMDRACRLLETTDLPIGEIAEQVGFHDYFYFSRVFKKVIGKSPSSYRMDL